MHDVNSEIEVTLSHVDMEWTAERMDMSWKGVGRKRRRRAATRTIAGAAGAAVLIGGLYSLVPQVSESLDGPVVSDRAGPGLTEARDPATANLPEGEDSPSDVSLERSQAIASSVEPGSASSGDGDTESIVLDPAAMAMPERDARVEVVAGASDRVAVRMVRGKSRFQVREKDQRSLEVLAGDVRIMVFASEFSVSRDSEGTDVWAHSGAVSVEWEGKTYELRRGEHTRFDRALVVAENQARESARQLARQRRAVTEEAEEQTGEPRADAPVIRVASVEASSAGEPGALEASGSIVESGVEASPEPGLVPHAESEPAPVVEPGVESSPEPDLDLGGEAGREDGAPDSGQQPASPVDWRELAGKGEFKAAYRALQDSPQPETIGALMLAADVHRMSGHPRSAARILARVVKQFPKDSRAEFAAFTLGKVLLDDLGQATRAARAFATVRSLAPKGSLAEDALAREVEAWSRTGRRDVARERARLYIERYPNGYRIRAVRQYAGL